MEKRIDKLERVKPMALMGMMGEVAPQWVAKELNKIIDHLNSQDQEENEPEKVYVDPIVPDFIAEKLAEERYNTREILLNGTKPLEVEDTPEQKEELVEIKKKLNGISVEYNIIDRIDVIWEEIESLLSEREEFTKDELFMLKLAMNDIHNKGNGAYDEIGEKIERMLSKLNKKK